MKISGDTGVLVTGGASGLGLAVVEKFVSLGAKVAIFDMNEDCLLYTSPSPRDLSTSRMPSSA